MIYINFLPIKAGGGLQNAFSFVKTIALDSSEVRFVVNAGSDLASFILECGFEILEVPQGMRSRIVFEFFSGFKCFKKNDTVFSLFGACPFSAIIMSRTISGCAYSNLLFPEVDFWQDETRFGYIKKKIIDGIRYKSIGMSDEIVFETEIMLARARLDKNFSKRKLHYVQMVPSGLVFDGGVPEKKEPGSVVRILYLTGWHSNKRIGCLLDLARFLSKRKIGLVDYKFILSIDVESSQDAGRFMNEIKSEGLGGYFEFLGRIQPGDVSEIVRDSDALINISRLESFSNNFVEAWSSKRVLVVAESEWARSICGSSALYVEPENPKLFFEVLDSCFMKKECVDSLVESSFSYLEGKFPTQKERSTQYKNLILGINNE